MSKFTTLIQTPTEKQKDRIFWYPWFWWSDGMIEDILQTFLEQPSDEKDQLIQEFVSKLLNNFSISERYTFKKMIIDVIKKDFSYVDKLQRELSSITKLLNSYNKITTESLDIWKIKEFNLKIEILQSKIKMMEENIDILEIDTGASQEVTIRKYRPLILPDNSICIPTKNKTLYFIEKIILEKEYEWWDYGWRFSWISERTRRDRVKSNS